MTTVRRATVEDVPSLIAMGQALHDESPHYGSTGFSPAKLERQFHALQGSLLSEPGAVFVAEEGGEVAGMAVCFAAERWFSNDVYVTDLTVYVRPEHRGGRAFPRLVQAIEAWAAGQGIKEIILGVSTEIDAERTVRWYELHGYQLSGYAMVKRNGT